MNSDGTIVKILNYIRDSLMTVLFALLVWLSFYQMSYIGTAAIGVLALYLVLCYVTKEPLLPEKIAKFPLLILIALGALTHITTMVHPLGPELIFEYVYFTVNIIFPVSIAALFMARPSTITVFIRQLKALSWILIVYAFYESRTRTNILGPYYDESYIWQLTQYGRMLSVFSHPIICAYAFAFMFVAGLFVPYRFKIVTLAYELLTFVCIILTRARTSLVALAAVFMLWLVNMAVKGIRRRNDLKRTKRERAVSTENCASDTEVSAKTGTSDFDGPKKRKSILLVLAPYVAIVGAACVAAVIFADRIKQFAGEYYQRIVDGFTGQDQGVRVEVIKNSLGFFHDSSWSNRLFGYGSRIADAYFMKELPALGWWDSTTDNMYVTFVIDEGLVGLALFGLIILFAVVALFCNKSHMKEQEGAMTRASWTEFGAYFVIYTAVSLFFFEGLYWPVVCFLFMVSLFMIRPVKKDKEIEQGEEKGE